MPDLLAGTTVKALDTPPTVQDTQNSSYSATNTAFGVTTTAGTYATCGVVFTAPTTGRVRIEYGANVSNSGSASTNVAPAVREGATIGSGFLVRAADLADAVRSVGSTDTSQSRSILVEGLTPGSQYNVRLEHRVNAGTGSYQWRNVIVSPAS